MNEPLNPQPNAPLPVSTPPANNNDRMMAIGSLVLGVINLCAWFLPICGIPLAIAGLVLGYFGQRDVSQKTLAIIGMVLSGIGLLLACGNAALGAWAALQSNPSFNF
jgi:hypothetical protein